MVRGRGKWFPDEKGYGFITPAAEGDDLCVRYAEVVGKGCRTLKRALRWSSR